MSKINDFLNEAKIFYLASVDGTQPKCRPLGYRKFMDGKNIFAVGDFKEVYHQLTKNPLVEIVATKPTMQWLRYTGKVVFLTDPKYGEMVFEALPQLREIYAKVNGKPAVFYLENAKAEIRKLTGEVEETLEC